MRREICAVVTKGTLTDGETLLTNPDAAYLMSITETSTEKDREKETVIGICLVDVSTGKFVVGQVFNCYNPSFLFFYSFLYGLYSDKKKILFHLLFVSLKMTLTAIIYAQFYPS